MRSFFDPFSARFMPYGKSADQAGFFLSLCIMHSRGQTPIPLQCSENKRLAAQPSAAAARADRVLFTRTGKECAQLSVFSCQLSVFQLSVVSFQFSVACRIPAVCASKADSPHPANCR
jgi:hypothetical protein